MWKKFLFVLMIGLFCRPAWAHPPSGAVLEYDKEQGVLHIKMTHVTKNARRHYIRRLFVYLNDEEVVKKPYSAQQQRSKVVESIPLSAETDDVIRVRAVCLKAGRNDTELVVE